MDVIINDTPANRLVNLSEFQSFGRHRSLFVSIQRGSMKHGFFVYCITNEILNTLMMLYLDIQSTVYSSDRDIRGHHSRSLKWRKRVSYQLNHNYVMQASVEAMKKNDVTITRFRSGSYPLATITDVKYADNLAVYAYIFESRPPNSKLIGSCDRNWATLKCRQERVLS